MIPFVDLKAQHASIRDEIAEAVNRVLDSCSFVLGSEVEAFESEFAAYCGTAHAVGVNNGTSALHLALLAAGVGPGDEVVTVSHTFVATVAAIRYCGATPVYVDVDPLTATMNPALVEEAITSRTRAILPVHLYGQCADLSPIASCARRHGLALIEDAAQAHGARYLGFHAGSLGDLACFSFYPAKNLGACGEGGAVVTSDTAMARTLRVLRDQGQSRKYHHTMLGYNYRLEAIQAAVLRVKLRRLDHWNALRRDHAAEYRRRLAGSATRTLDDMPWGQGVAHVFPVFTPERDALQAHLHERGVSTGIHYPVPVHLQPAFAGTVPAGALPVTEQLARETLSLPMYPELGPEALESVVRAVRAFDPSRSPDPLSVCRAAGR
jgi:dTDP-4-amino-4,6-dideoxygalactose transaminase